MTNAMLAPKIVPVVIHPRIFMAHPLTLFPMMLALFVINMMRSISGGVENP